MNVKKMTSKELKELMIKTGTGKRDVLYNCKNIFNQELRAMMDGRLPVRDDIEKFLRGRYDELKRMENILEK